METIPNASAPGGTARKSNETVGEVIRVFATMGLMAVVMIVAGIVVGLGCGGVWYALQLQAPPQYEAVRSVVVIVPEPRDDAAKAGLHLDVHGMRDLRTHAEMLKSPLIIQRAVDKGHLAQLASLKNVPEKDRVRFIATRLTTHFPSRRDAVEPELIEVRFRASTDADATAVLNAVLRSYEAFVNETFRSGEEETVRLLNEARDEIGVELKKKRDELRKFSREAPCDCGPGISILTSPMDTKRAIDAKRAVISDARTELRALIATVESRIRQGTSPEEVLTLIQEYRTSEISRNHSQLNPGVDVLIALLHVHLELSQKYGLQHPQVRELGSKISLITQHLTQQRVMQPSDSATQITPEQFIQLLRFNLETLDNKDKEYAKEWEELEKTAQYLQDYQLQFKVLNDEARYLQELQQAVLERFKQIDLMKDVSSIRTMVIEPVDGAVRVVPNLYESLTISALGGAAFGALAAVCILPIFGLVRLRR